MKMVERKDPVYGDYLIHKMITSIMKEGKKVIAEKIVYKAIDAVFNSPITKGNGEPHELITKIIANIMPSIEVISKRVRGSTVPVPTEISQHRAQSLALRWVRNNSRKRKGPMHMCLAAELLEAFEGKGPSIKQKEQVHSMAKANRTFAHFARKTEN
jgi:small subunit ribosomal protein S7